MSRSSRPPEHPTTLPLPSTVDLNLPVELLLTLKPLIPLTLKLCAYCLTYRPTDPSYWHSIAGYERYDF
ncbi:hypothetical protein EPUS_03502 [Endocarpon pusillum Z07020]|uniref:Uncharacterized protein n=1 Tax=Endocarpon pusillum (strain Z07020 / HMAS-L-300199) TaxID=1263415 RepID=U1G255_ENDPU|nr:uncharacterized protein EPUS_03502 [Endocarpon pusillum Z07020]ERF71347.1 hypothetical protein EPUS_03502 [Endocarpon pusillum Z07020]